MERETFKMRKQFLEDFFDEDRVKFFNTIKKDILIRKKFIRNRNYNHYILKTSLLFLDQNIFKLLCKFIKPFSYFLYSFTYQNNFLENKILYFSKLDIEYRKQILNSEELLNKDILFSLYFIIPQPFEEEEEEDNNFLRSIKISDCLNENIGDLIHLKLKIYSNYVNVEEEDYSILGGEFIDLRREPRRELGKTKIINALQTFKSNEYIICLSNPPNVMFCNCGHMCFCLECERKYESNECPICKTKNNIIRSLN